MGEVTAASSADTQPLAHMPICAIGASAGGVAASQSLFRQVRARLRRDPPFLTRSAERDGADPGGPHPDAGASGRGRADAEAEQRLRHPARPRARDRRGPPHGAALLGAARASLWFCPVPGPTEPWESAPSGMAGSVVMVREPAEAEFSMMPRNAVATGAADFVAPLSRLAEHIGEVARGKDVIGSLDADGTANDLRRIIGFLRTRTDTISPATSAPPSFA